MTGDRRYLSLNRDEDLPELVLLLVQRIRLDMKRNPHKYPPRLQPPAVPPPSAIEEGPP